MHAARPGILLARRSLGMVESMPGGGIGHLRLYMEYLLVGSEIVQSVGCWWRLLGQGRSILVDW
jgi:hypothetical protein